MWTGAIVTAATVKLPEGHLVCAHEESYEGGLQFVRVTAQVYDPVTTDEAEVAGWVKVKTRGKYGTKRKTVLSLMYAI